MKINLLALILLPVLANAENLSDKILVSPPKESNEKSIYKSRDSVLQLEDQTPNLLVTETKAEEPIGQEEYGFRVGVFGASNYQTYKLEGRGVQGSFDSKSGYTYGFKGYYSKANNSHGAFLNADHTEVRFKAPYTPVKPFNIYLKKETAQLGYSYQGFFDGALQLYIGYEYIIQKGTQTIPYSLISTFNTQGPIAGASFLTYLGPKEIALKVESLFFWPTELSEKRARTGSFRDGFGSYSSIMFSKKFTNHLIAGIGAKVILERYNFNGTPSQGTRNAKFKYRSYSLPIEMRYQF
jgi:hypothetical protein